MEFKARSICFRRDGEAEADLTTFLGTTVRLGEDGVELDFSTSEYASEAGGRELPTVRLAFADLRGMMVGTRISEAFLAFSAEGFEQILIEPEPTSLRAMEKFLKALISEGALTLSSSEGGCEIYLREAEA